MDKFREGKVLARRYRNRRIGEFLKEIDLSEKKSTGFPKYLAKFCDMGIIISDGKNKGTKYYLQ